MTPTFLRASSLSAWSDCERRSAARMFRQEVIAAGYSLRTVPRGIGALIGVAVHFGAELMLAAKATTGKLPPEVEPQDAARTKLRQQIEDGGEVLYDTARGVTHRLADAADQSVRMVASYQINTAPTIEAIVSVERRLEAKLEDGAIVLSGQSDLVCREPGAVRDLKTGVAMPASWSPQVGAYSLLNRSHGFDIHRASVDFVPRVRRGTPQPAPVTRTTDIRDAEVAAASIVKRIASAVETFRNGDKRRGILPGDSWSFMANPSSNLCSPRYCSAHGTSFCKEGRPERKD